MTKARATGDRTPGPLRVVRERFGQLAGRAVRGLPPGWEPCRAGQLAARLLDPQVPAEQVDAVWAELIAAARTRDETAVLVCAGIALPMLQAIAGTLCGHWAHRADTEAMVIVAFLDAVSDLDVTRPNVAYRLRWATFHRTCVPVRERRAAPVPVRWNQDNGPVPGGGDLVSCGQGHPEMLLALAVHEGVISAHDAGLIVGTRLEHRPLEVVAADAGIDYLALAQCRWRAEQRLVRWLRERIADAEASSGVEIAALDRPARHRDRTTRHRSAGFTPRKRPETGALHEPHSAAPTHTWQQEDPRCA